MLKVLCVREVLEVVLELESDVAVALETVLSAEAIASVVTLPVTLGATLAAGLIVAGREVSAGAGEAPAVFVRTTEVSPFGNVVAATAPPANVKLPLVASTAPPGPESACITKPVPKLSPPDAENVPAAVETSLPTTPP